MLDEEGEIGFAIEVEWATGDRPHVVAKAHFCEGGGETGFSDVVEGEDFSGFVEVVEGLGGGFEGLEIGEAVFEDGGFYEGYRRSGFLELWGKGEGGEAGRQGEGDEGGRNVEVVEGAGHGVLAADGG